MEVKFHDIGEGMTEGEIIQYFIQPGEEVSVDDPLVEVQTDKMVAELPSPVSGIVTAIHFELGEIVTVGQTIITIEDGKAAHESSLAAEINDPIIQPALPEEPMRQISKHSKDRSVLAAPYTRKIARDHHIDIEKIKGTGKNGRVTEDDVYRMVKKNKEPNVVEEPNHFSADRTMPFTGIRKQIAKNITYAANTIPHVTHYDEADVTNIMALRRKMKTEDIHVSVVAFFLKALAITLKEFPIFNASLDEEKGVIRLYEQMNIGLATATDAGLLVPVLHGADQKSIQEIHDRMKVLTKKAQNGKLNRKEMSDGTFTISNVGPLGGLGATPIIRHPESAIMAFHRTKKMPVVMEDDAVEIREMMNISLSFDHRLIDGADAVQFTNRFIHLLEDPARLFIMLI